VIPIRAYYSIGEISRLFGMSIQTLRHYDRIGLLRPAYVNHENNYRYYSHEQFLQIKLIKYLKTLGFSLAQIRDIVNQDLSSEVIIELLREQEEAVNNRIDQLVALRQDMRAFEERLAGLAERTFGEAFLDSKPERKVIAYDYINKPNANLAVGMRKILADIEREHSVLKYEPGMLVSYTEFAASGRVEFKKIIVELDDELDYPHHNILRLPAGPHATIIYEGATEEGQKYYGKIVEFISDHGLSPKGDFIHAIAVSYVNSNGTGVSLHEVSVLTE